MIVIFLRKNIGNKIVMMRNVEADLPNLIPTVTQTGKGRFCNLRRLCGMSVEYEPVPFLFCNSRLSDVMEECGNQQVYIIHAGCRVAIL